MFIQFYHTAYTLSRKSKKIPPTKFLGFCRRDFLFVIALYWFQKFSQYLEFRLFQIHFGICVDIHSGTDICVSENILYDLHIYFRFTKSCCKGMSEWMTAESRQQRFRIAIWLIQTFGIAVTDNSFQCFIESDLIMYIPKTIHENKVSIAVNFRLATDTKYLLLLLL